MSKAGIKETTEVIAALGAIAPAIVKTMKDGVQVADAVTIYEQIIRNEEVKAKIMAAIENIQAIPEEVKDLQTVEIAELVLVSAKQTFEVIKSLQA